MADSRACSLLPGIQKIECSGVFTGDNAHEGCQAALYLQGTCSGLPGAEVHGQRVRLVARGVRATAVGLMAVWLMAASGIDAHATTLTNISHEQFHAQVLRLQRVVAACGAASAACDSRSVGNDVQVGEVAHGGFEQHWQWLRATLDKAKTANEGGRAAMLRDATTQLSELAQDSQTASDAGEANEFRRARAHADTVLSEPEFQRGGGPTWWDRAKAWMVAWIERFFLGVAQVGAGAPWLGTLLEWLFFIAAAAGLLLLLLRNIARQRLRIAPGDAALECTAWDRGAEDWAARAEQCATAHEWRDAVHCIYWAAIVAMEARRAWRHNPARTPREYVRLLKPGSAQQQHLRGLTRVFERVWYGHLDADAALYNDARTLYDRLAKGVAEPGGERDAADATLAAGGAV